MDNCKQLNHFFSFLQKLRGNCLTTILKSKHLLLVPKIEIKDDLEGLVKIRNSCMVVCLVMGLLQYSKQDEFEKLSRELDEKKVIFLKAKILELLEQTQFETPGPHKLYQMDSLLDYTGAQFHIYMLIKGKTLTFVKSRPPELDRNRKQIYLFETEENGLFHCDLIKEPGYFFNIWGQHCHHCNKVTNSGRSSYRHICEKIKSPRCWECNRPYRYEGDIYHPNMSTNYCLKYILEKEPGLKDCPLCNLSFENTDCQKHHNRANCIKRYKCKECKQVLKVNGHKDKKIARHDCSVKECLSCNKPMPIGEAHFCSLFKSSFQTSHPNLGFLNILHQVDQNGTWIPCMALLMAEEREKGTFVKKCFTKDSFHISVEEEDCFKDNYWKESGFTFEKTLGKASFGNNATCREKEHKMKKLNQRHEVISQMFDYIINKKRKEYHNTSILLADNMDMNEVLKTCIMLNIDRDLRNKGSNVITIRIKEYNITFLALENYLTQKKIDFRLEQGNLDDPFFFPTLFTPQEMNYIGKSPSEECYDNFQDSKQIREMKTKYIAKGISRTNWNYQREALRFINFETECIAKCALNYLKECWHMNRKLHAVFCNVEKKENELKFIHPFTRMTPTASGVIYSLYKIYVLNHEDIRVVTYEHDGRPIYNCSKPEHEFCSYLSYYDKNIISTFTHGAGMVGFKGKGMPDAYDIIKKVAYYMNGCYTHGHNIDKCKLNRERAEKADAKLAKLKIELGSLKDKDKIENQEQLIKKQEVTIHQMHYWLDVNQSRSKTNLQKFLQENCRTVIEHVVVYDCEWQCMKETDSRVSHFMTFVYEPRPLDQRLVPRKALKGGLVETYKFAWTNENKDECFEYLDVVSLYPYLACQEYPIGAPQIWIGPELEDVKFTLMGKLVRGEEELFGLAHVRVKPPENCSRPVLAYETSSKRKLYAICAACAEMKNQKSCNHKPTQRSWIGHYCIEEIELAHYKGYSFDFLEVYHYSQKKAFIKPFIRILALEKIKASGWPSNVCNELEKQAFLDKINAYYEASGTELELKHSDIQKNQVKRQFIKTQLNSLLGKLAQGANDLSLRTVKHHKHLWDACMNEKEPLYDFQVLGNSALLYQRKLRPGDNKRGNSTIYAMITARGRVLMFNQMDLLEDLGCTIYSVSTDCIGFSKKKSIALPSNLIGDLFGQYKREYTNICSYLSLGPRNYNVCYLNENGEEESVIKISGLMISAGNSDLVNRQLYKQMVYDFIEGKSSEADIPQQRVFKTGESVKNVCTKYKMRNLVFSSRAYLRANEEIITQPFGYNKN